MDRSQNTVIVALLLVWFSLFSLNVAAFAQEPQVRPNDLRTADEKLQVREDSDSAAVPEAKSITMFERINRALQPIDAQFGIVNGYIQAVIFFPIPLVAGSRSNWRWRS